MSESWEATSKSVRRLVTLWKEADQDTKYDISFLVFGLAFMALAIVSRFGLDGALFCMGLVIWKAGCINLGGGK